MTLRLTFFNTRPRTPHINIGSHLARRLVSRILVAESLLLLAYVELLPLLLGDPATSAMLLILKFLGLLKVTVIKTDVPPARHASNIKQEP
jgi:hypothetical protein